MSTTLLFFFALALVAGSMLVSLQLFCPYFYDVKLGGAAVEIVIFKRFVVLRIPYDEIAAVERVSFMRAIFSFSLGLANRPFGEFILLHRTRGFFRRILVTPSRSDEFYDALLRR
jgi:hypothetical protein